jgi:hypothetical protein
LPHSQNVAAFDVQMKICGLTVLDPIGEDAKRQRLRFATASSCVEPYANTP